MHVVREDPEQEGLLYAGTLEGAYVSFDQGKHWQTLQQNLPATPVTDFKVHHGDLLASTMGRSFWIMDDVAPLRQIAASVTKPTRPRADRQSGRPGGREGQVGQVGRRRAASVPQATSCSRRCRRRRQRRSRRAQAGDADAAPASIKPFDGSNVFLFTPAPAYRMRYVPIDRPSRSAGVSAGRARASTTTWRAAVGEVKLEILDAAGKVVRSFSSAAPARGGGGRGGGRRGGGLPSALPTKAGMNRFVWDLRYAGRRRRAAATGKAAASAAGSAGRARHATRRG